MLILFLIYTIILEAIYFLLSPILFAVFRFKPGSERLAIEYPKKQYKIMIHAASVGEINGARQLILELLNQYPDASILLTTNTKTGRKIAQKIHPRLDVVLSPLDVYHLRLKQILRSRPELILIVETEIWPTLFYISRLKQIPVIFVNARMSESTLKKYLSFKPMLNWLGQNIKAICTQTDEDQKRFSHLFDTKCIRMGNLKYSVQQPEYDSLELKTEWGYQPDDKIVVFGSSRPGEEKLILDSYDRLHKDFSNLKLIIVPRHLERLSEIIKAMGDRSVSWFSKHEPVQSIHIIDEMGHLIPAYALCDIAVIGGSFYPFGGHNPLEAAFYSKVIIMGPHFESCKGTVKKLQKADAIIISSKEELYHDLYGILSEPKRFTDKGIRARQVIEENKDSLANHLNLIKQYLEK